MTTTGEQAMQEHANATAATTAPRGAAAPAQLNNEQQAAVDTVAKGHNVFLTGGAGVGKSFTIAHILAAAYGRGLKVGMTAMTGSAAVLIEGSTLHSFLGIGLAKETSEYLARRIKSRNQLLYDRILELDMLIVDECSMLNDVLFSKISKILALLRNKNAPFGGVQVVLVGDPFQLCPIEGTYCFLSDDWSASKFEVFLLKTNMRQKDDAVFIDLLDRLRWGKCSDADLATLKALKSTSFAEGIVPTRLYSVNRDVDRINNAEMERLVARGTIPQMYYVKYSGNTESRKLAKKWAESCKLPETCDICVGAQVMLTRNMNVSMGLVNGARGVALRVTPDAVFVKFASGIEMNIEYYKVKTEISHGMDISLAYMPLRLAWAVSIHKSQGMTLDAVEIDLGSSIFAYGQGYTALSRARNLSSVKLVDVAARSFRASSAVIDFYQGHL